MPRGKKGGRGVPRGSRGGRGGATGRGGHSDTLSPLWQQGMAIIDANIDLANLDIQRALH